MPLHEAEILRLVSQDLQVQGGQTQNIMSIAQTFAREKRKPMAYEGIIGPIDFSQSD
jgi:hypothetical protein